MKRRKSRRRRTTPPADNKLDLRFDTGGESAGFTSVGVAGFQSIDHAAVIRELIQNSLDAARKARRPTAELRFEIKEHATDEIPGIAAYRKAFNCAVEGQKKLGNGTLPAQAGVTVRTIENCLKKQRCKTLFVHDNGIGLDVQRMNALLGDGLNVKDAAAAGAFGNGHYVAIPASDLRYVLYGGTRENKQICAGHAILASHKAGGEVRGKDGYFVRGFRRADLFDRYDFAQNGQIHGYILERLHWIAETWGTGTVVAVPGFNAFHIQQGKTLWELVARPAACNFFPAFARGELRLEVVEDGAGKTLDSKNLAAVLDEAAEQKRSPRGFLSGSRAQGAYETIASRMNKRVVKTEAGDIPIWLCETQDGGISRIDLCRAGMWISDDLPRLRRQQFANLKPFHCVLQIDASQVRIHDLVRKAEGPLHNHLEARKCLSVEERKQLEAAFQKVAEAIRENIGELSAERMKIDDVLAIDAHGIALGGQRRGKFDVMRRYRRRDEGEGSETAEDGPGVREPGREGQGGGEGGRGGGRGISRPAGRPLRFRAAAVPTGLRSCAVRLRTEENCPAGEVRFVLDESIDESCDAAGGETFARIENVEVENEENPTLTRDAHGAAVGVVLHACSADTPRVIRFDYRLPKDLHVSDKSTVVLQTMMFRRSPRHVGNGAPAAEQADGQ